MSFLENQEQIVLPLTAADLQPTLTLNLKFNLQFKQRKNMNIVKLTNNSKRTSLNLSVRSSTDGGNPIHDPKGPYYHMGKETSALSKIRTPSGKIPGYSGYISSEIATIPGVSRYKVPEAALI
jgi:hypothetical protein